jgi:hypothetical protein
MSQPRNRSEVKSDEEMAMIHWLHEAVRHNLVESWQYEPRSFTLFPANSVDEEVCLKTKTIVKACHLHREESYKPDFEVGLTSLGKERLFPAFKLSMLANPSAPVYIDIKGEFSFYQTDERYFSIVRKALYSAHGIWVTKIIPFSKKRGKVSGLFADTFAPECLRMLKNGSGLNAMGRACCGINEFLTNGK